MDKEKALSLAIEQIEKEFGKGAIMRLGEKSKIEVDVIPTGAISLDIALGVGGIPRGRVTEIYGQEASGKTTLALHILAEAQKRNGQVAFIDAALQYKVMEKKGNYYYYEGKSIGQGLENTVKKLKEDTELFNLIESKVREKAGLVKEEKKEKEK